MGGSGIKGRHTGIKYRVGEGKTGIEVRGIAVGAIKTSK